MNTRTTRVGTALCAAALLVSGCGSAADSAAGSVVPASTTTAVPAPTAAPTSTPAAATASNADAAATQPEPAPTGGPAACVTSDLEFAIEPSKGMGEVRSADVVITNVHADGPCSVFGYGGLGLLDADGGALTTNLTRLSVAAQGLVPQPITLAPGGSALKHLEWTDTTATGGSAAGCVTSTDVVITPPNDEPSAVVPFAATVCQDATITGWPYVAR